MLLIKLFGDDFFDVTIEELIFFESEYIQWVLVKVGDVAHIIWVDACLKYTAVVLI